MIGMSFSSTPSDYVRFGLAVFVLSVVVILFLVWWEERKK